MQVAVNRSTPRMAIKRHESIRKHNDAVTTFLPATRRHRCGKEAADRYSLLLRWMLQQVPSVALEQSSLNSAKVAINQRDSSRGLERAHSQPPDDAQEFRKCRRIAAERQRIPSHELPAVSPISYGTPLSHQAARIPLSARRNLRRHPPAMHFHQLSTRRPRLPCAARKCPSISNTAPQASQARGHILLLLRSQVLERSASA